jgi:hypothetical protein
MEKVSEGWRYSPKPMEQHASIHVISLVESLAAWNLLFLSTPCLDDDMTKPSSSELHECFKYVTVLALLNGEHAKKFPYLADTLIGPPAGVWADVDSMSLWNWDNVIGKGWYKTFYYRLEQCVKRHAELSKPVVSENVIYYNFRTK